MKKTISDFDDDEDGGEDEEKPKILWFRKIYFEIGFFIQFFFQKNLIWYSCKVPALRGAVIPNSPVVAPTTRLNPSQASNQH